MLRSAKGFMHGFASMYRLQFNPKFTFAHAIQILDFLKGWGIEAVYGSPIFKAMPGSWHGYDVVSFTEVNPELGGEEGFCHFIHALHQRKMGFVFDLVANHMAASPINPWWKDLLEKGKSSEFAPFFDIDWDNLSGMSLPGDLYYRRFFDIKGLAALRMEEDKLFSLSHKKIFEWVDKGWIQALRIDHPDGLLDPLGYIAKLRKRCPRQDIIVEKIVQPKETLSEEWQVQGTVGYKSAFLMTALFVHPEGKAFLHRLYEKAIGQQVDSKKMLVQEKKDYLLSALKGELVWLVQRLTPFGLSREKIKGGLLELFAHFPIYRTYIRPNGQCSEVDKAIWEKCLAQLRDEETKGFFRRAFLSQKCLPELLRFQQISPAIMAKGFEDTHCYTFNRCIALNDVGSDPDWFGIEPEDLHRFYKEQLEKWPRGWQTASTHDSKRSEDVRLRLAALSEMPEKTTPLLEKFMALAKPHIHKDVPDANQVWFYLQTLLGFWPSPWPQEKEIPALVERLVAYMVKAAKEAKQKTHWMAPDIAYEAGVVRFVKETLKDSAFLTHLKESIDWLAPLGRYNTYAAWTIRMAAPGVIDIYQGNERFRFDLVDPDNRRLIDYTHLADDLKFHVIVKGLALRRQYKALILSGEYHPIDGGRECFAFLRRYGGTTLLCVARRFFSRQLVKKALLLPEGGTWECLYTGKKFRSEQRFSLEHLPEEIQSGLFLRSGNR